MRSIFLRFSCAFHAQGGVRPERKGLLERLLGLSVVLPGILLDTES